MLLYTSEQNYEINQTHQNSYPAFRRMNDRIYSRVVRFQGKT